MLVRGSSLLKQRQDCEGSVPPGKVIFAVDACGLFQNIGDVIESSFYFNFPADTMFLYSFSNVFSRIYLQ